MKLRGKEGIRTSKEASTCDTIYWSGGLEDSHRAMPESVCALIQDKEEKPSLKPLSLSLPHLFLYVVFSNLSWLLYWPELEPSHISFRHSCTLASAKPKHPAEAVVDLLGLCMDGLSPQLCQNPSHPGVTGVSLRAKGSRCTAVSHISPCSFCPCSLGKVSGQFEL